MIDAITYEDMLDNINNQKQPEDIVGILITRPDLSTGDEILRSLDYYHHLTNTNINFYLPGYGAYWNSEKYPDMTAVTNINGIEWYFSNKAFVEFIECLENKSCWQYTGESELLLISYHNKTLDFSEVGLFHLDKMLTDDTISSISSFITRLNRLLKNNRSTFLISLQDGTKCVIETFIKEIINQLPTYICKPLSKGRHYICRDFSKYF